jgi:hypothetical protein
MRAAGDAVAPHLFTDDEGISRAVTGCCMALVLSRRAFAYDGVLIGAADYRFGRAVPVSGRGDPIGAVTLLYPQLGIAGIWGGLLVWMVIRVANHEDEPRPEPTTVSGTNVRRCGHPRQTG